MTAKLGALPAINSGGIGAEPGSGLVPGNEILLPIQIGRPETVNDIGRSHLDEYGSTNGDVNLVRRLDDVLRIADVGIFDFPPPLVSYHVDAQGPHSSDPRQGPRRRHIHKNENQQYQRG